MLVRVVLVLVLVGIGARASVELPRSEPVYRPGLSEPSVSSPKPDAEPFSVDFLSDQPAPHSLATLSNNDLNRHNVGEGAAAGVEAGEGAGYAGYAGYGPQEVTYPDVAYAAGYGYEPTYPHHTAFDRYGNAVGAYYDPEPEPYEPPTTLSLLWSAVPDARSVVNLAGRCLGWMVSSGFVLAIGGALFMAACSFTGACRVTFPGLPGTVTEQLRSIATPDTLERAAGVLQRALRRYRTMQSAPANTAAAGDAGEASTASNARRRRRRALRY